ncbi:MAG: carboxypeptidase-like regulatory domain-containing protein [Planctomycetaceae bacterium]|jgi:hypothetical protein|nr:carboxypeptidase-like regulatory domain-containing protein [Planctomycetaceae bacterium]
MLKNKILCVCLVTAAIVLLAGCNKKTAIKTDIVQGKVTMDGSPLADAMVTFSPTGNEGKVGTGTTDASGQYKLQTLLGNPDAGTTSGDYIVTVSKQENVSTGKQEMSESEGKMVNVVQAKQLVPAKFTNKKSSPLKATVVEGQVNSFDFDVSK